MKDKEKILLQSVISNDIETLKTLISNGINLNAMDSNGHTALHLSAIYNTIEIATLLVENGAKTDIQSAFERTALHWAATLGNFMIAESLILNNAKLDIKNIFGNTPLHSATLNDHAQIIELLIINGANIHECGNKGYTTLHMAALLGNNNTTKLLVKFGADVNDIELDKLENGIFPFIQYAQIIDSILNGSKETAVIYNFKNYIANLNHPERSEVLNSYSGYIASKLFNNIQEDEIIKYYKALKVLQKQNEESLNMLCNIVLRPTISALINNIDNPAVYDEATISESEISERENILSDKDIHSFIQNKFNGSFDSIEKDIKNFQYSGKLQENLIKEFNQSWVQLIENRRSAISTEKTF